MRVVQNARPERLSGAFKAWFVVKLRIVSRSGSANIRLEGLFFRSLRRSCRAA